MSSTSGSSTKATSFQHTEKTSEWVLIISDLYIIYDCLAAEATEANIKRKKFDEFGDLPTKCK